MKKYTYFVLAILSLNGVFALLFATKLGISIGADSTYYLAAARNLLIDRGLSVLSYYDGETIPMTHYPPLYPILLSILGRFGISPLDGARWLNALLFGANILLAGFIISKYTPGSFWNSMLGSFMVLNSLAMLEIHSWAITEPSFIFFGILGLFLLVTYIDNSKPLFLIASSITISLAVLDRYIGIALVISSIIGILLLSRKRLYIKIIDGIIFFIIGFSPIALWFIRNLNLSGSIVDREMVFHPITFSHIKSLILTIATWLLPASIPVVVRVFFLTVMSLLVLYFLLSRKRKWPNFSFLLIIFILIYLIFLIISISFFDAHTLLDNRILSPVYISGIILIFLTLNMSLFAVRKRRLLQVAVIITFISLVGFHIPLAIRWIIYANNHGQGYERDIWKQSQIIQNLRTLPSGICIYTNAADAIYFLTGKPAIMLPRENNPVTKKINNSYSSEVGLLEWRLKNKEAVLVYFNAFPKRDSSLLIGCLKNKLSLRPAAIEKEVTLYLVGDRAALH